MPAMGMYEAFWHGLSTAHDLVTGQYWCCLDYFLTDLCCTVVDVGPGEEASKRKIKGMFSFQEQD